jgi:hypothetical protein
MMSDALARSEERLNKALRDFEEASKTFMKCRAFSHKTWVDICCRKLLEASDEHGRLRRAVSKSTQEK